MKLQCILISLALANVLAITTTHYKKMVYITNLHIGQAFTQNENELRTVIKDIVIGKKPMAQVAMMLAVPELADITNLRRYIRDACLSVQKDLQEEIIRVTSIPVPEVDPNRDFSDYLLSNIGAARRAIIKLVLKPLIIAALNGDEPAFKDFAMLCRLLGLFRDMKYPDSFIKTALTDHYGICILTNFENKVSYYRFLDNKVWELEVNGSEISTQLLREGIDRW